MDIKEIALKIADSLRNKVDGISHMQSNQGLVAFAEALIESYKAELLKEVGEPVAARRKVAMWRGGDDYKYEWAVVKEHTPGTEPLFTSDQVAAAIAKATEPLEDQLARAEQRVAEWQPISTAPITCNSLLIRRNGEVCIANWGDYDEVNQPKFTHWMPLPKAPANGASS